MSVRTDEALGGELELGENALLIDEHGLCMSSIYRFLRVPATVLERTHQEVTGFLSTRLPEHTSLREAV